MTIPNLPWWASDAQKEFNRLGWMSETAVAAGIAGAFWDSDLCGKSSIVIVPFVNSLLMPGGLNTSAVPGVFAGRYLDTAIYSPNYMAANATTNYVSNRDMGFRGAGVTHSQVKALGLDPSQVLVTGKSIKVGIRCEVDYHGWFGYLRFTPGNPFANWVELKHINDVGPTGYSTYSFSYDLPVPGANEIILPAFRSERGVKNLKLGVGGYEGDSPITSLEISLMYSGTGYPRISSVTGSVIVNSVYGNFYGSGGSSIQNSNYIGVKFASNPGVNKITLKSIFDNSVAHVLSRKKIIVSTTEDWSHGYPPKIIYTYADSETEYESDLFGLQFSDFNNGQSNNTYRIFTE